MPSLCGKTALVTGASRGIGRAIALALAGAGSHVLVHYGSNDAAADTVLAEIRDAGGRADKLRADLRSDRAPHELARLTRALVGDRLDILVANAGIGRTVAFAETTLADFDELFAVNVRAPFFLLQQLLPILTRGSSIVFLSSLAAQAAGTDIHAYAASKGAIDTLVRHLAVSLGPRGIRVNAVAPGIIATDMTAFTRTEAGRKAALGMQSLQRLAQPADVAPLVAFLASDDARWITGDTLRVDGGSRL